MKNIVIYIFVVFSFLLLACDEEEESVCCNFKIDYRKEYNLYNSWELVGTIRKRPFKEECAEGVGGYITFNEDGTFGGAFSCNAMGGEFELVDDDEIKITNNFQTLRGCIGDESAYWEDKFSMELRNAGRFIINGNKLILFTSSQNLLVFKAVE